MFEKLPPTPSIENVDALVKKWLNLLAAEDYINAFNLTLHEPYFQWTPELTESIINGYGLPYDGNDQKYIVTKWDEAQETGSKRNKDIIIFENRWKHPIPEFEICGQVYYDLPLNNQWSDLTATFLILTCPNFSALELNEIHVF
jgi:hypothetical protein